MPGYVYYVYIMASHRRTLYTGVTNFLRERVFKHKLGTGSKFAARYHCVRCVHFEVFEEIVDAIAREKEIKAWRRSKKIKLIEATNPEWCDHFAWLDEHVQAHLKSNLEEVMAARAEMLSSIRNTQADF